MMNTDPGKEGFKIFKIWHKCCRNQVFFETLFMHPIVNTTPGNWTECYLLTDCEEHLRQCNDDQP